MRKRSLLVAVALSIGILILIASTLILWKGEHIAFRVKMLPANVPRLPISGLKRQPIPDDWVLCKASTIEFRVPPEYAHDVKFVKSLTPRAIVLKNGEAHFSVSLPATEPSHVLDERTSRLLAAQNGDVIRLQSRVCKSMPSEFRWSMNREQLEDLQWLLAQKAILVRLNIAAGEELLEPGFSGLLTTRQPNSISYEWFSTDYHAGGSLMFDRTFDIQTARTICTSLNWNKKFRDLPTTDEVDRRGVEFESVAKGK